jgi:hypothetical protein
MSAIDEMLAARQREKAERIADLMWIDRRAALYVWLALQIPCVNARSR